MSLKNKSDLEPDAQLKIAISAKILEINEVLLFTLQDFRKKKKVIELIQCEIFEIFLSFRFYVKSILTNLEFKMDKFAIWKEFFWQFLEDLLKLISRKI